MLIVPSGPPRWTPRGKSIRFTPMGSGKGDDPHAGMLSRRLEAKGVAGDIGGAFGDLGTFLPHALGAITVAGLAPVGVMVSFGVFYVASGLFYRLPIRCSR
jgi:nitrate/nitrite transporter NarK